MSDIQISDSLGATAKIALEKDTFLSRVTLTTLRSATAALVGEFGVALESVKVQSATLGANFTSSFIDAGANRLLAVKVGANAALKLLGPAEKFVFATQEYDAIPIQQGQYWLAFELDTSISATLGPNVASGFGVSLAVTSLPVMATYKLFKGADKLGDSLRAVLSDFRLLSSAANVRAQKPGAILVADVSGSVKLSGSWSMPCSITSLSLAGAPLPFNYNINVVPTAAVTLTGSISVTGEYATRSHRVSESELHLGVYKKKGTELAVGFTAAAGLAANVGSTDLIAGVVKAIAPGIRPQAAGLTTADATLIEKTLNDCVNRSLSISLNLSCSASVSDEAAVLFSVDLSKNAAETDIAIEAALNGDWTAITKLPNARELRNVIATSHETTHKTVFNLLGVYNSTSIEDFVRTCRVVHDTENGSVTITDTETAKRIAVAATPWVADSERLRRALYEGFVATATYAAANASGKLGAKLEVRQNLLLYANHMDRQHLLKNLLLGTALHLMTSADVNTIAPENKTLQHVRIAADADFDTDAVMHLFFGDVAARTPRDPASLRRFGRSVLASLLDRTDQADNTRWEVLHNDAAWAKMDQNNFDGLRSSYPDYVDITWWADAMAKVGPRLADLLAAVDRATGPDPSKDADFMAHREKLAHTLGEVTRNTHAAFEKGWPIAAMVALSGFAGKPNFNVSWDGSQRFPVHAGNQVKASGK